VKIRFIMTIILIAGIIAGLILIWIPHELAHANSATVTNIRTNGSPITIYRDSYSPTSQVHITIRAPDFNSNPYLIDTIGDDPQNKIIISTRESSIPYRLVETGSDTGIFTGYVTLSGTTSVCSPVCGPTDGFVAAGGDDAITVSFTYGHDRTITSTSHGLTQSQNSNQTIPEFPFAIPVFLISITSLVVFYRLIQK